MDIPDYLKLLDRPDPQEKPKAEIIQFDREAREDEEIKAKLAEVEQTMNQFFGPPVSKVLKAEDPELLQRKELARQGDAKAANELAYDFYLGHTVEASEEEAEQWLRMGCGADGCTAYMLYREYTRPLLSDQEADPEKAMYYLRLGAEEGNWECSYELGELYFKGNKVERDLHQAIKWLSCGAEKKNEPCIMNLIGMYLLEGSEDSVYQALKWCRVLAYMEKAAWHTEYPAYRCYLYGYTLQQTGDLPAAIQWYQKGVRHDSGASAFQLAQICERGDAGEPDHQQALEWLRWITEGEEEGMDYLLEALDCACREHDVRRPQLRKFLRKGMEEEKDGADYLACELLMLCRVRGKDAVYIGPGE